MDEDFQKQFNKNGLIYKKSLERIIAKYSKLQDQDGGIEVDLNSTSMKTLRRYMRQSQKKLDELELMSPADSREESMESQDITTDSKLDVSHHDKRDRKMSTHRFSDQDDALSKSESSEMTWSLSDESQRNISVMELQPEDEDTGQEMSLSSEGSCLADVYPNMINQIGRAWRRQHVSEAADSVLRRYRKWRHLSNKSNRSTISNTTLRKTSSNSNKSNRNAQINQTINSPLKKHFLGHKGAEAAPLSPLQIENYGKDCQVQHHSPGKGVGLQRRKQQPPVLVMDLPSSSEETLLRRTFTTPHQSPQKSQPSAYTVSPLRIGNYVKDCQVQHHSPGQGVGLQRREQHPPVLVMDLPSCSSEETFLRRTFTISHQSPLRSQASAYTVSPSQPCYLTAKAQDISFGSKGSSLSPLVKQTAGCSTYALEASKEKPDIYGSPVRQSPSKARLMSGEGLGGIHHAFSVSPRSYSQGYSRELKRPRPVSTSFSSPPQTSTPPRRMLHYQDSRPIVQSQVHPPLSQSLSSVGSRRLRRHLSFDSSSLPSNRVSYSAKELDNDFIKLYHKFVCQSKSPFLFRPPCRVCEKSSEASRGHSSSALAALALSPHRSLLRKRHRKEKLDDHPQSKRSREQYYTYSPGSRRYFREMRTRRFPPSELEVSHGNSHTASVNTLMLQNSAPR